MAARLLCIGDLHIKANNIPETLELKKHLLSIANETKPDRIIVMGDTLDNFNVYSSQPVTYATELLEELVEIAPLVFLIGNHDLPNPNAYLSKFHAFGALKKWENTLLVDRQCEMFEVNGIKFCAVPYVPDGRFIEALESNPDINYMDMRAIFAHQQFIGCNMDSVISKTGDIWPEENPLVISGHIHQYQRMQNNIIYVGTPRQTSFADCIHKTISLFEFTHNSWEEIRYDIPLPPKLVFKIHVDDVPKYKVRKDAIVRLDITGTVAELNAIKLHPKVKKWKSMGVIINPCTDDTVVLEPDEVRTNISNLRSTRIFRSFKTSFRSKIENNTRYMDIYNNEL